MENKIIFLTTLADHFSCFKQKTFVFQKKISYVILLLNSINLHLSFDIFTGKKRQKY